MTPTVDPEAAAKERAFEKLREHGLTALEGPAEETETCEVCGSEEPAQAVVREAVLFQGAIMVTTTCAMCRADQITRDEDRESGKLAAKLD